MKGRMLRGIAAATLLTTAVSSTGCGYFLYPERRGNTGGGVDGGTLVMDLLWLLPGIVPGVVALIVDFSSGAVYRGGHGSGIAVRMSPRGHVAVRLPDSPTRAQLEFRLVTSEDRMLAHEVAFVGPTVHGRSVELQLGGPVQPNETIYLEVVSATGASARFPTSIEIGR
jgi:hypothetical protein